MGSYTQFLPTLLLCLTASFTLNVKLLNQRTGVETCVQLIETLADLQSPTIKVVWRFCLFSKITDTPASTGGLMMLRKSDASEKYFKIIRSEDNDFKVVDPNNEGGTTLPNGYKLITKGKTKMIYKIHHDYKTWDNSLSVCQSENGTLLKLHTIKSLFLFTKIQPFDRSVSKKSPWIGLRYTKQWKTYVWADGKVNSIPYWSGKNPPDSNVEDRCGIGLNDGSGYIIGTGSLTTRPCRSKHWFICQMAGSK